MAGVWRVGPGEVVEWGPSREGDPPLHFMIMFGLVVRAFGCNKTWLLVGMSLAQIGEFAFVLLSPASNLKLIEVTTPLLFKLIPAVVHLGVLLRWFPPDSTYEIRGESLRTDSAKHISLMVIQSPKEVD